MQTMVASWSSCRRCSSRLAQPTVAMTSMPSARIRSRSRCRASGGRRKGRNAAAQNAAQGRARLVDRHLMPAQGKLVGRAQAGRPAAHHGDAPAPLGDLRNRCAVPAWSAIQRSRLRMLTAPSNAASVACLHARRRTDPSADRGQRLGAQQNCRRRVGPLVLQRLHEPDHVVAGRAGRDCRGPDGPDTAASANSRCRS